MTDIAQLLDMELAVTPDTYTPMVDEHGNYIDRIPMIRHGIECPCGSRREKKKVYENASKLASHLKTKGHQQWLQTMNQNKANYYVDNMKQKEVIETQQKIIVGLRIDMQVHTATIRYLTEQLKENASSSSSVTYAELSEIN
uniref:Uncharacterized protein n=1 Tax=viral metagenome TaxID=1070528 RepID=A0A6C0DWR6_9ZZZZ